MNVPPLTGDSDDAVADAKAITFYNKTVSGVTSIWRCGPPIQRNGSLDFDSASPVKSLLVENASLTVVNTCGTTVVGTTDTRMVAYQPILSDTPSSYQPPCNILRARALFITD
ncbi:hypothetical protein H8F24_12730 [Synechococcus sp. CBW1002]|nr:hypothetical protein H8F24_12730 [Synechococcus sp. CBW1002]